MKNCIFRFLIFMLALCVSFSLVGCFDTPADDDVNGDDSSDNTSSDSTNDNGDDDQSTDSDGSADNDPNNSDKGDDDGNSSTTPDNSDNGNQDGNEDDDKNDSSSGDSSNTSGSDSENEDSSDGDNKADGEITSTELPHYDYSEGSCEVYNKNLFYRNDYDIALGDPTVLYQVEDGIGWYYVTGTKSGADFSLFKTKNFTDWESLGVIYTPPENFFGKSSFWAPQLLYDPDADWSYYLGADAGEGKGLYMLFFSARKTGNVCLLSVAFSKTVDGEYKNFIGTNANGDYIDESNSLFELENIKGLGLYDNHIYGSLYKENRGFIDASPYVDPITGDKYLYMVRNRSVDSSNDVWGVKMIDWVSPDYKTTTPLSSYGYTTIDKEETYNFKTKNKIDEGPFVYYKDSTDDGKDNGKYYLTLSLGDTNDKLYPVCQAIGDSPLGPFEKLQPEDGGLLICPGDLWDIHGSGHHAFFEANGELYIAYHTYIITEGASIGSRYFACSKVEWIYNENGNYIMRANGPSKTLQPLPSASSEYINVAPLASINAQGSYKEALTDGLIALSEDDAANEYTTSNNAVIILSFDDYVTARAILIYNSYDFNRCFTNIEKIEFSYRKEIDGKIYTGFATVSDLGFDMQANLIPSEYLIAKGETNMNQLRPMGAAICEFDEIEINKIKIYVNKPEDKTRLNISEIVILGKTECDLDDSSLPMGAEIEYDFEPYYLYAYLHNSNAELINEDFITLDGVLDEDIWTESKNAIHIAGATKDQTTGAEVDVEVFGERNATVYTYIGNKTVYFAFDVTDKNLYCNTSLPQGRSTCVELYLTNPSQTTLSEGCYSIRVNPMGQEGDEGYRLGIYVPNANGNEWTSTSRYDKKIAVAIKVNGRVQDSANDESYTTEGNVGYTVEIAISKELIADCDGAIKFTAAFVQDQGYDLPRINNSFISGTHYTTVDTWITITNEGIKND